MTTNKNKVVSLLEIKERTTTEIAEILSLRRSYISAILNELVNEGKVTKKKGRPVCFSINKCIDKKTSNEDYTKEFSDPFQNLVGYEDSLSSQIQLCKQSVKYPRGCLPIMLLGDSGVGKSFLAEKIYQYAIQEQVISKDAPFITFNCADYANNPELISSILFGYQKGAFTGADKNKEGLFELSDGGFLFLDEIHRLNSEGQEKLFTYLDKHTIVPLGGNKEIELNTNLIFATTESTDTFLDTFTRRIPIIIDIPNYINRSISERRKLVINFFINEAKIFNKEIEINGIVFEALINFNSKGNIGRIKNIVKILCTSANNKSNKIVINLNNVKGVKDLTLNLQSAELAPPIKINKDLSTEKLTTAEIMINEFLNSIEETIQSSNDHRKEFFSKSIGKLFERIYFEETDNFMENLLIPYIKILLELISNKYGLQTDSIMENYLTKLVAHLPNSTRQLEKSVSIVSDNLLELLKSKYTKEYTISESIYMFLENNSLVSENDKVILKIVITTLIISRSTINHKISNALIISHGTSTATSISSVVNTLFGQYIYEAFDMPLETSKKEIVKKIENYLSNIDVKKDLLIFVDMGSLLNIGNDLKKIVQGNMVVINNTTTQTAIQAANEILKGTPIQKIAEEIVLLNKTTYNFTQGSSRENIIFVSCLSGAGTSVKIKNILEECTYDIDVSFQELDYLSSEDLDKLEDLYPRYNILGIISTFPIEENRYPIIKLSELVKTSGLQKLGKLLKKYTTDEKLDSIINLIIEKFTSQNLLQRLTFLNPTSVIPDVQTCLYEIELSLSTTIQFENKYLLYIHVCVMIERLIKENQFEETNELKNYFEENIGELTLIKESFKMIENKYNVSVNHYELMLIHRMITDTQRKNC